MTPVHKLGTAPSPALVRKYDGNGPRYTSYPTALQFDPAFGPGEHRKAAQRSSVTTTDAALSLYLHIPFCDAPCFYCGCTKIVTRQHGEGDEYVNLLGLELGLQAGLFPARRTVEQLHFGGGTPTWLSMDQLGRLFKHLHQHFRLSREEQREFSIEIDPRTVTPDSIEQLARLGFNRASFGIQDFDPAVQKAVNRRQSVAQVALLIEAARRHGFRSLSVDLIYGLPKQTPTSVRETLDQVIRLRPDRISAYSYAHVPQRFKAQNRIRLEDLPNAAQKLELFQLTIERMLAAGYLYIGMDHFALPSDELACALSDGTLQRNFQGYSTRGGLDLLGIGMSSISRLGDSYSQNARTMKDYRAALVSGRLPIDRGLFLSTEDCLRRDVIAALMCQGHVDISALEDRYGIDFHHHFELELEQLEHHSEDGLVRLHEKCIEVTETGRCLLRALAMPFDASLRESAARSTKSAYTSRYARLV
ncbi:oxygen-independent coproporphyrinogen III oxidase [Nevskia sp.]|uniref:oxygen-independent coproporphyrinogen III oxidase n=1 Tax=Nevskia sp. TaxID=1929292 RepID=UPI0025F82FEA|nr:oxygen-independent coproporphyrinogen III oxidase [Nevskia sp.]